ncbi:MAG: ISKra4 family transposase [Acidimicrobiales bacterium]
MGAFERSQAVFSGVAGFLFAEESQSLSHEELEARVSIDARELARQLLQDHLDLRAAREVRAAGVIDAAGVAHNAVEPRHRRPLQTLVGAVEVSRFAYRARGTENLHPADAVLNLPVERHSHGLRELAAIEAARGSYEEAKAAIERNCGVSLGKRQVEELARRAAADVGEYYEQAERPRAEETDALVISVDGKGIVMRPDSLREATKRKAALSGHKLKARLSKGEKRDRKRMAELAVVYDCTPAPRTPADVLAGAGEQKAPAPLARDKWCTGSVVEDAREVISAAYREAERRDPCHRRPWVALVDGNDHQIRRVKAEAKARSVNVSVICDLVHVLEYLWGAAWCFFAEGDPAAEEWVAQKGRAVLEGKAGLVAGAIGRKATMLSLDKASRKKADDCVRYLKNKAPYLDYPTALARGWPVATGVIEGAVRHVVRDRFDITGARWSLEGAEAILKLRAVRTNHDWTEYWRFHLAREHHRIHQPRYLRGVIPAAA